MVRSTRHINTSKARSNSIFTFTEARPRMNSMASFIPINLKIGATVGGKEFRRDSLQGEFLKIHKPVAVH